MLSYTSSAMLQQDSTYLQQPLQILFRIWALNTIKLGVFLFHSHELYRNIGQSLNYLNSVLGKWSIIEQKMALLVIGANLIWMIIVWWFVILHRANVSYYLLPNQIISSVSSDQWFLSWKAHALTQDSNELSLCSEKDSLNLFHMVSQIFSAWFYISFLRCLFCTVLYLQTVSCGSFSPSNHHSPADFRC